MTEVVHDIVFVIGLGAWASLIALSIHPTWGAQLGIWLQGLDRANERDKKVQELLDSVPDAEGEPSHLGQNVDRHV